MPCSAALCLYIGRVLKEDITESCGAVISRHLKVFQGGCFPDTVLRNSVVTFLILDVYTKLKKENKCSHASLAMVMLDTANVRTFVREKAPNVRRLKWTNSTTLIIT